MHQKYNLLTGDVLATLATLPADYFDATQSDPPYGLSFMGKQWDHAVPSKLVYEALLRVQKPGSFGLHFGGTRTFHRLAVNIEDAGFEIRDCLSWLYGSGFPKSHNVGMALDKKAGAERAVLGPSPFADEGRTATNNVYGAPTTSAAEVITAPATPAAQQWNGYGTALKPAWEPCLLVQKPLDGTFANNVVEHGCGALNIDGSRIGTDETLTSGRHTTGDQCGGSGYATVNRTEFQQNTAGRFPANLVMDELAGEAVDATQPTSKSASAGVKPRAAGANVYGGNALLASTTTHAGTAEYGDAGGPSRFFYCAKVGTKERNAGCEHLEPPRFETNAPYGQGADARAESTSTGSKNNHPTLKPLALTTYLAGLLLPPPRLDGKPRRILVPFSGSGSEVIGCLLAGWDEVVGIEIDPAYVEIARARIAHHCPTAVPT